MNTLDAALGAAVEGYVRAHPQSLAHHVERVAAENVPRGAAAAGGLPFPLLIASQAGGRLVSVDGTCLIDCRGHGWLAAFGPAPPRRGSARKLRLLFHLDLLVTGLLVGQDGGVAVPADATDAACLRAAIAGFLRRRAAVFWA